MILRHTIAATSILALFSLGTSLRAEPQPVTTQVRAAATTHTNAERHPEIRKAIAALEQAKSHLQSAAHDFGGHRVDALAACNKALEQLHLALQYDKD